MASSPKVSVVIPCFNLGAYLGETVDSVLNQTYQDFEILIVDDGSTDPETQRVLGDFARPRTTLYRTPNRKLAGARNFLIEHASGEYLCALDADDKLHPEYLARTAAVLDADPSLTFVSTHLQMFGDQTGVWPSNAQTDLGTLLCDDTITTAALVRRAAVLEVGGYDERMPHQGDEDWDLWLSLVERGHKGLVLPDVLFFYRRRPNSMCVECTSGQVHLDLIGYLARKHADSYREHLVEVLLWKDERIRELRMANGALEIEVHRELTTIVECRRLEVDLLKHKLEMAKADRSVREAALATHLQAELNRQNLELDRLRAECSLALAQIDGIRSSVSWRVTAPARAVMAALRRLRSGSDQ